MDVANGGKCSLKVCLGICVSAAFLLNTDAHVKNCDESLNIHNFTRVATQRNGMLLGGVRDDKQHSVRLATVLKDVAEDFQRGVRSSSCPPPS